MADQTLGKETQSGGRYHVQHVQLALEEDQEELRAVLDAGERKEWHLVGVAGGMPNGGVLLFWDTARPSFGRSRR